MKRLFCILIAMSLVFITGCGASNDTSQDVLSPEIIRGGPVSSSDENPSAGQVSVYDKLAEQIKANKNKDALFAVKVVLCGVTDGIVEEYAEEKGQTLTMAIERLLTKALDAEEKKEEN